jgi:DNA-binding transcriptional ArsR family regulator
MSVGEIVDKFKLSFAAISKHVAVLERARLITKHRRGKEKIITFLPDTLTAAQLDIEHYTALWGSRLDMLEKVFKEEK